MFSTKTWKQVNAASLLLLLFLACNYRQAWAASPNSAPVELNFPPALSSYSDSHFESLGQVLRHRVEVEPLNLLATIIFLLAIIHTFSAPRIMRLAHKLEAKHLNKLAQSNTSLSDDGPQPVSFVAHMTHFFGEIEAIFGIWVIPLLVVVGIAKGFDVAEKYLSHGVSFVEPVFVVVVMTIAATRPVMETARKGMEFVARLGGSSPAAWWISILTVGPILGSFITEPAAMTISALLLAQQIYALKPPRTFAYATLGLLFVNVSIGGVLTHVAAPPVIMVAGKWHWDTSFMLGTFGWKAVVSIILSTALYGWLFRKDLAQLATAAAQPIQAIEGKNGHNGRIPLAVTLSHFFFLAWTVASAHSPVLVIGGFLFFLAFVQATEHHQSELSLRSPLLVGFFLAGLVIHGGLQAWWIEPLLTRLGTIEVFAGAMILTAFNDNAAITYLATLVPSFSDSMKYAVVAGAVAGGGMTVIANAPNPAGNSILSRYFPGGILPLGLALGAILPTLIAAGVFLLPFLLDKL